MKNAMVGRLVEALFGFARPFPGEVSPRASMESCIALAAERVERGMFAQAVRLYEACPRRYFANDAAALYSCARAYFFNGESQHAEKILARLEKVQPAYRREDRLQLQARVRDALGKK
jgi:hypothetical protein